MNKPLMYKLFSGCLACTISIVLVTASWSKPAPTPDTHQAAIAELLDQAALATEQGQLDNASALLERALRIVPLDPLIWHFLGQVRMHQGRYLEAQAMAEKSNALLSQNDPLREQNKQLLTLAKQLSQGGAHSEEIARLSEMADQPLVITIQRPQTAPVTPQSPADLARNTQKPSKTAAAKTRKPRPKPAQTQQVQKPVKTQQAQKLAERTVLKPSKAAIANTRKQVLPQHPTPQVPTAPATIARPAAKPALAEAKTDVTRSRPSVPQVRPRTAQITPTTPVRFATRSAPLLTEPMLTEPTVALRHKAERDLTQSRWVQSRWAPSGYSGRRFPRVVARQSWE